MATTKRNASPARPRNAAPAANNGPQRPGRPGGRAAATPPANATPATPPAAPQRPGRPAGAAAAPPAPNGNGAPAIPAGTGVGKEILAMLAGMQKQIDALTKRAEKAPKTNARTLTEILDNPPALPKKDWRADYHGQTINVHRFEAKNDSVTILDGQGSLPVLLAIPRDADIGGKGAAARGAGMIAVYWELSESGDAYLGQPAYVSYEQLGTIWAD